MQATPPLGPPPITGNPQDRYERDRRLAWAASPEGRAELARQGIERQQQRHARQQQFAALRRELSDKLMADDAELRQAVERCDLSAAADAATRVAALRALSVPIDEQVRREFGHLQLALAGQV